MASGFMAHPWPQDQGTASRVIGDQQWTLKPSLPRSTLRTAATASPPGTAVACDLRTKRRLYRIDDAAALIEKITPRRRKH